MTKEKERVVHLNSATTYKQKDYPAGINTVSKEVADLIVRKNLGHIVDGDSIEAESAAVAAAESGEEFEPLSLEETMKRFQSGDSSDEVFKSLKFHQPAIVEGMRAGESRRETIEKTDGAKDKEKSSGGSEETGDDSELPKDFPQRHVFINLGFKTLAEVQALTEEKLIELDGIGEATAKKALSYGK